MANADPVDELKTMTCLYIAERQVRETFPELISDKQLIELDRKALVNIVAFAIHNGWTYRDKGEGAALFDLIKSGRDILNRS